MEIDTEMEIETSETNNSSSSSRSPSSVSPRPKRLGLKNTIQTNFGDDYVFQIVSSQEISTMAVSLSSNTIKLYSPGTGQYLGECLGHSETIHEISYCSTASQSPAVLCSCSADGTVRAWDTRTLKEVSKIRADSSQEIYSFAIGGSNGNLLAAGSSAQILFWDWRYQRPVACLEESHMDDVTQVHFVPDQQSKLISASVDGLLCLISTDGDIDDDNNLESVMNVETSVAKVGFFGESSQKLWCLTNIETLSIWDWQDGRREVNFDDARSLASGRWNLDQIDYFVDCYYSRADDRLWVIGGTGLGTLGYFPVDQQHGGRIGSPEATLEGGHAGVVRTVLPSSRTLGGCAGSKDIFGWSGGEDGRLCCWLSDGTSEANHSWISNALVMRSLRDRRQNKHHPYY